MNDQMKKMLEKELREMGNDDLNEVLQAFGLESVKVQRNGKGQKS